jgi:hypothetical protein
MSENVERPRCDKCHMLMVKNGQRKTAKGIEFRFRCRFCGVSKMVYQPSTPKETTNNE